MTDSEWLLPTCYEWFIAMYALSWTVSKLCHILARYAQLYAFFLKTGSGLTPISPPGGVTSQIKWQILNGNCQHPICDNANFRTITCRFRVIRDYSDFL